MSLEVTNLGVQVHGGMGFIEETGAAQYYRDAKILTIYEGTTAIQANDLVGRKTARDGGQTAQAIARQIAHDRGATGAPATTPQPTRWREALRAARDAFEQVVDFVAGQSKSNPNAVFAGSVPYLMLAGNLVAGWQTGARAAGGRGPRRCWRGRRFHAGQDRDRALLCRAHPVARAGSARQHRRWRATASPHSPSRRSDRIRSATHPCPLPRVLPLPRLRNLPLPIIGAPLFIISNPKLVIEQCKAGVVGAMPALNARPAVQLDEWLAEITETLAAHDRAHPDRPAAPFAINQIVHKSNDRLDHDMEMLRRSTRCRSSSPRSVRAPTSTTRCTATAASCCTTSSTTRFAHKAIEKGADGLIAVAAGAGGHAGVKSPFALIQEIREWFDGPLALCGAIATGGAVLAAQAMGADFAYIGSAFIATARSARDRRLQAGDRRRHLGRHRLFEPVHRRARQLPEALDPRRRPRPGQPAARATRAR